MSDDTTTNDTNEVCEHHMLKRCCEICEMKEALEAANKEAEEMFGAVRDDYAQAALTGLLAKYGRDDMWDYMVNDAFQLADLAMERRKQR